MPGFASVAGTETDDPNDVRRASQWAWGLCWLMFASTVLNYMDRQSLALVGPQLRREFGIDFETFGWVLSAFSLTYALFQVPAGFLADALPTWRVYAGAVALWSFAAMAAAFSPVLGALIALRALLGVGESFNWPCALRITGEILPPKDRSLGNGIFNSGAAVGAVLTPLFLPVLVQWFGWRAAFVIIGAFGFMWVAMWMTVTRGWKPAVVVRVEVSTRMNRRAQMGFGLVGLAGVAVVILGAYWPAAVPVKFDRLKPSEPLMLVNWLVKPGDKLDRRKTPVAEVSAGSALAQWLAPEEGTVDHTDAKAGDALEKEAKPLRINNSAQTFAEPIDAVKPLDPVTLVKWHVQPGDRVEKGALLAEVDLGGQAFALVSEHDGSVARFEVESGKTLGADQTALVQYVTGFQPKANGLPAVTYGIAILLLGSLAVARVLPESDLGTGWAARLGQVVRKRRFWILVLVSSAINVCWHFLVNWLPTYLQTDRQMRVPGQRPVRGVAIPGGRRGEPGRRVRVSMAGGAGTVA